MERNARRYAPERPRTARRAKRRPLPSPDARREERGGAEEEERVEREEVAREADLERNGQQEEWDGPEPKEELAPVPFADGGSRPERGAEEGSEAERGAEPPEDDLGELVEEVRRSDVLVRVGNGAGVADHRPLLRHGGEELAREVRPRADRGGTRAEAERDGPEGEGRAPEALRREEREEGCGGEREEERRGARLRRNREARGGAGEEEGRGGPPLERADEEEERGEGERDEGDVVRREVGVLDVEDGDREERAGEESRLLAEELPPEEREEDAAGRAPRGGEGAPGEERAVPGERPGPGVGEEGGRGARDEERERAVGVELRVELQRGERELLHRLDDPALVGVVHVPLVPVEAEEADAERRREEEREGEAEGERPRREHQMGSLRKIGAGSARRRAMTGRQNQGV
jgi:hypothetical protein